MFFADRWLEYLGVWRLVVGLIGCTAASQPPVEPTSNTESLPVEHAAEPAVAPASIHEAQVKLERLYGLVGDWEASTPKGAKVRVSYKLVSAGSVLVQTFTPPSGRETITVFHLDGSEIVATHYCAQGNQPRLRLTPSDSSSTFTFSFWDATNLTNSKASHLHRLTLVLTDADHYSETEEYLEDGQSDVTVLEFGRVVSGAAQ